MKVEGLLLGGMRLILGLTVLFLSNTPVGDAKPPGDCSSVFLGSLSELYAVHIPSTGIYHSLDGTTLNNHRVYKHTNGHAYMYFLKSRSSGQRFWAVGPEVGSEEAEMAISAGDSDTPEVAQQKWRLRNNDSESWSSAAGLKAVCVDDEFGPCTSGRLRMTGVSGRSGLQKRRMGQYVLTNRTHDLRPVYRHKGQDEFLFYSLGAAGGGKWIVGPEVGKFSGGMFVSDFGLRPEFIVQAWQVFTGRYFANDPGVKLECQGVDVHEKPSHGSKPHKVKPGKEAQMEEIPVVNGANYGEPHSVEGDTGSIQARLVERGFPFGIHKEIWLRDEVEGTECDSACEHGGHCQHSDPDDFRCICTEHYFGLHCQIDVDCGQPSLVSGQQLVSTTGHYILDVAFYQCPANTVLDGPPGVICQVDGKWTDPPKCLDGYHLITPMHDDDRPTIAAVL